MNIPRFVLFFGCLASAPNLSAQSIEPVNLCIIHPASPGGFRTEAAHVRGGRDTVVSVGGVNRLVDEGVMHSPVGLRADWYLRGTPFVINVTPYPIRLFTYGSARVLTGEHLGFVGFVRGTPVYVQRQDIAPVLEELKSIHERTTGREFVDVLSHSQAVRAAIDSTIIFFVPFHVIGCTFQALIRAEEVR